MAPATPVIRLTQARTSRQEHRARANHSITKLGEPPGVRVTATSRRQDWRPTFPFANRWPHGWRANILPCASPDHLSHGSSPPPPLPEWSLAKVPRRGSPMPLAGVRHPRSPFQRRLLPISLPHGVRRRAHAGGCRRRRRGPYPGTHPDRPPRHPRAGVVVSFARPQAGKGRKDRLTHPKRGHILSTP